MFLNHVSSTHLFEVGSTIFVVTEIWEDVGIESLRTSQLPGFGVSGQKVATRRRVQRVHHLLYTFTHL